MLAQDRGPLAVDRSPVPVQPGRSLGAMADVIGPEHLLVVGWNPFGEQLLEHWTRRANPASTVEVAAEPDRHPEIGSRVGSLSVEGSAELSTDAIADRILRPSGRPAVDTVVFLADHGLDRTEADVRVLLELAALRTALAGTAAPRLVVELRDVDSLPLVDLPGPDDYVVSDASASRFIAQLAEQPERRRVFLELYDPSTSTLRIDTVDELGLVGEFEVRALWSAAYERGLIAIGWRRRAHGGGEFVLNARSTDRVELRPGDQLVSVG